MKEPRKCDFGYQDHSIGEESGWMLEGGEEAYNMAVESFNKEIDDQTKVISQACIDSQKIVKFPQFVVDSWKREEILNDEIIADLKSEIIMLKNKVALIENDRHFNLKNV